MELNYELADVFRAAVLEAWAGNDPDDFLAYMEAATVPETRAAAAAFAVAAALEPEGVPSMMGRLPEGRARSEAERTALEVLILTDTDRALAYLASLSPGEATNTLHYMVAQTYARHDLDAALAWADTLRPPSNPARTGVLWALVKADPVRGADIFVDRLEVARGPNAEFSPHAVLGAFTLAPRELFVRVVERFRRSESEVVRALYDDLLSNWTQHGRRIAMAFPLPRPARIRAGGLGGAGMGIHDGTLGGCAGACFVSRHTIGRRARGVHRSGGERVGRARSRRGCTLGRASRVQRCHKG